MYNVGVEKGEVRRTSEITDKFMLKRLNKNLLA